MFTLHCVHNLFFGEKVEESSEELSDIRMLTYEEQKYIGRLKYRGFFVDISEANFPAENSRIKRGPRGLLPNDIIQKTDICWATSSNISRFCNPDSPNHVSEIRYKCAIEFLLNPSLVTEIAQRCKELYGEKLGEGKENIYNKLLDKYGRIIEGDFFANIKDNQKDQDTYRRLSLYMQDNLPYNMVAIMVVHGLLLHGQAAFFEKLLNELTISIPNDPFQEMPPIKYMDYSQLSNMSNLSAEEICERLIRNDYKLYGEGVPGVKAPLTKEVEGEAALWANHLRGQPDCFYFAVRDLSDEKDIIGNYSFLPITEQTENFLIQNHVYNADLFSLENTPHCGENISAVVLLNLSLNDRFQSDNNYIELFKAFFKKLVKIAEQNHCFITRIYTALYREDMEKRFHAVGFRKTNISANNGLIPIYAIDFSKSIPIMLRGIAPELCGIYDSEILKEELTFRYLDENDQDFELLRKVSRMLFLTDEYIFPWIMDTQKAMEIMPLVLSSGDDDMFNKKRIFVSFYKKEPVGLILEYPGGKQYDHSHLKKVMKRYRIDTRNLDRIQREYFTRYEKEDINTTCIMHFYVAPRFKLRLARELLSAYLSEKKNTHIMTYALCEKMDEMQYLVANKFKDRGEIKGWTIDNRDLPCVRLEREKDCLDDS